MTIHTALYRPIVSCLHSMCCSICAALRHAHQFVDQSVDLGVNLGDTSTYKLSVAILLFRVYVEQCVCVCTGSVLVSLQAVHLLHASDAHVLCKACFKGRQL